MQKNLKLVLYPDDRLRVKTKKIKKFDRALRATAEAMIELMEHEGGIGISAQQCGLDIKIVVCRDPRNNKTYVLCNPEIIKQQGRQTSLEYCLSFSQIGIEVTRPEKLIIKYHDLHGVVRTLKTDGILSIVAAHELDHLVCVLLCDPQNQKYSGTDN